MAATVASAAGAGRELGCSRPFEPLAKYLIFRVVENIKPVLGNTGSLIFACHDDDFGEDRWVCCRFAVVLVVAAVEVYRPVPAILAQVGRDAAPGGVVLSEQPLGGNAHVANDFISVDLKRGRDLVSDMPQQGDVAG